jgi:hypothetical protein
MSSTEAEEKTPAKMKPSGDDDGAASSDTKTEAAEVTNHQQGTRPSLSLHDALALGEIELGLSNDGPGEKSRGGGVSKNVAELQRLPYLLRLLAKTRPLSAIPSLQDPSSSTSNNEETKEQQKHQQDPLLEAVVERLEHVAATYSMAEGVDVVTNYLVPALTKPLSQVPPLVPIKNKDGSISFRNTEALLEAAKYNPKASAKRRKRRASMISSASGDGGEGDNDDEYDSDVEMEDVPNTSQQQQLSTATGNNGGGGDGEAPSDTHEKKRKHLSLDRRDSSKGDGTTATAVAEDSLEATVSKTLTELVSLIVQSLAPVESSTETEDAGDGGGGHDHEHNHSSTHHHRHGHRLFLTADDSILAESGKGIEESAGAATGGSDLGSTLASIMHHAPVLKSQHVAVSILLN